MDVLKLMMHNSDMLPLSFGYSNDRVPPIHLEHFPKALLCECFLTVE